MFTSTFLLVRLQNEDGEVIGEILEDGQEIIIMKGGMEVW